MNPKTKGKTGGINFNYNQREAKAGMPLKPQVPAGGISGNHSPKDHTASKATKPGRRTPAMKLLVIAALLAGVVTGLYIESPALAASYVTNAEDRCVNGVVAAFKRIAHHGEPMGFNVDEDIIDPTMGYHWQSVARHPYAGNIFYLTKNGGGGVFSFDSEAGLGIVRLGVDQSNLPRRSNLHVSGEDFEDSAPPALHKLVDFLDIRFGYDHLGGMQAAGDLMAVPYEESSEEANAQAFLFDIRAALQPVRLQVDPGLSVLSDSMGAVGILPDGLVVMGTPRYIVLALYAGNTKLRLWSLSVSLSSGSASVLGDPIDVDYQGPAFQNLQLVKDCNGALYAVGTRVDDGQDTAYLHQLNLERDPDTGTIDSFTGLERITTLHLFCTNAATDGERYCDFNAGAGIYVDPQGTLALYGVEHDNDGHNHSTKMTEFWDRMGNPSQGCDAEGAWVTLYNHVDFAGQTLTMTYFNEMTDDFDDFTAIPWDNHASSVRACLPAGCSVDLCRDSLFANEPCFTLNGPAEATTTALVSDANLHDDDLGDSISSMRFTGACGPIGGWASGEPDNFTLGGEDCAESRDDGLLSDAPCDQLRPWACQSLIDPLEWIRSTEMSPWSAQLECPVGYAFTYPQNATQQQALSVQIGEAVWVNLTDQAQEARYVGSFFALADDDGDGVATKYDNCPDDPNPFQDDFDGDGEGDVCDDTDDDTVVDSDDECPLEAPAGGLDADLNGCTDTINGLIEIVEAMGSQPKGLLKKLEDALQALEQGKPHVATNKLHDFVDQVEAHRGEALTDEQADLLVNYANNIIALI
jgi:hypothetical protein